jgi:hypothetical protein
MLDSAGAPVPEALDGINLRTRDETSSSRMIVAEAFPVPDGGQRPGEVVRMECALFEASVKAVRDASGGISIYDLTSGREERLPNVPAATIDRWVARFQAVLLSTGQKGRPPGVLSPERDILRSLGYIGR